MITRFSILLGLAAMLAQAEPRFLVLPTSTFAEGRPVGGVLVMVRSTNPDAVRFRVEVAYSIDGVTRLFSATVERGNNPEWPPYDTHVVVPPQVGIVKVLAVRVTEELAPVETGGEVVYNREYGGEAKQ